MRKENRLVFLAMGEVYARQAIYALLSLLKVYRIKLPRSLHVVVYTDTPALFSQLQEVISLELVYLSNEKFSSWKGDKQQLFRTKIRLLQEMSNAGQGSIVYADTDIIFYKKVDKLFSWLNKGNTLLHTKEATLSTEGFQTYCDSFCGRQFTLASERSIDILDSHYMWNAGVIGLPRSKFSLVDDVLELNDRLLAINDLRLVEQLAFSVVLAVSSSLRECHDVIFHYCWNGGKDKMDEQIKQLLRDYSSDGVGAPVKHLDKYKVYYPSTKEKLVYFSNPRNFVAMLKRKLSYLLK
ncbi:hypothetical protein [Pontibacter korlensis]|uniref:hypothetical protein n=1 Tax=Pontibacter korlensis TaxID=400092 RepID=UPI0011DDFED2|nr:hypothetical protein [Pontibacter korlensis]